MRSKRDLVNPRTIYHPDRLLPQLPRRLPHLPAPSANPLRPSQLPASLPPAFCLLAKTLCQPSTAQPAANSPAASLLLARLLAPWVPVSCQTPTWAPVFTPQSIKGHTHL
ncbi:hypothetical protein DSO57_1039262 [Entomophthora muscae]|uniref:Uncharacterized protein n=1 Tax=Entomophthora muscae TaxID=34485 RepID=A0ACC2S0K3_9FUNG|nr:hypothetical protein DSO57_1039262 [Entomophthora muscae]